MNWKIPVLIWVIALASAEKRRLSRYKSPQILEQLSDNTEPAEYDFDWEVKYGYTGSNFEHKESRTDKATRGSYSVQLPDGRVQTVTYYVDAVSGYVATVTYSGKASYPEYTEAPRGRGSYSDSGSKEEEDDGHQDIDDEDEDDFKVPVVGWGYKL